MYSANFHLGTEPFIETSLLPALRSCGGQAREDVERSSGPFGTARSTVLRQSSAWGEERRRIYMIEAQDVAEHLVMFEDGELLRTVEDPKFHAHIFKE
ncbi:MAG: hypothetical protein O2923_12985 [Verrucomicrobia bacterium]|nr:hypothetical protein [Verrucomicrobiota bacterium]